MTVTNTLIASYKSLEREYLYFLENYGHDEEIQRRLEDVRSKLVQINRTRVSTLEQDVIPRQTETVS